VTAIILFWATEANSYKDGVIIGSMVAASSLILLAVRRRLALRRQAAPGLGTGEVAAERMFELEQRLADLESVEHRMAELEERLDFAERMLAAGPGRQKELAP
jgi:ubiquinone biosynthesis protein UbiJ